MGQKIINLYLPHYFLQSTLSIQKIHEWKPVIIFGEAETLDNLQLIVCGVKKGLSNQRAIECPVGIFPGLPLAHWYVDLRNGSR